MFVIHIRSIFEVSGLNYLQIYGGTLHQNRIFNFFKLLVTMVYNWKKLIADIKRNTFHLCKNQVDIDILWHCRAKLADFTFFHILFLPLLFNDTQIMFPAWKETTISRYSCMHQLNQNFYLFIKQMVSSCKEISIQYVVLRSGSLNRQFPLFLPLSWYLHEDALMQAVLPEREKNRIFPLLLFAVVLSHSSITYRMLNQTEVPMVVLSFIGPHTIKLKTNPPKHNLFTPQYADSNLFSRFLNLSFV